SLDGKTFVGETGERGKPATAKTEKDTLHFANGKFHSTGCDRYGFTEAPYTATAAADGTGRWSSQAASARESRRAGRGREEAETLAGSVSGREAGQAPIEYWVQARAQK